MAEGHLVLGALMAEDATTSPVIKGMNGCHAHYGPEDVLATYV